MLSDISDVIKMLIEMKRNEVTKKYFVFFLLFTIFNSLTSAYNSTCSHCFYVFVIALLEKIKDWKKIYI